MAQQLALALGEPVRHVALTPSQYAALGFPGADDLANMFQFKSEFERMYCDSRSVGCTLELHPTAQSFAQWLAANASRIPIADAWPLSKFLAIAERSITNALRRESLR